MKIILYIIILLATGNISIYGEQENKQINVGIIDFPPCVYANNGAPIGFDIDIWEGIAKGENINYNYVIIDDFSKTFEYIKNGDIDIAISGIAITNEREKIVDFSHPYLKSGLSIVTKNKKSDQSFSLKSVFLMKMLGSFLQCMNSSIIAQLALTLLVLVLIFAHILFFLERSKYSILDYHIRKNYFWGIFDAIYCVILSFSTGFCDPESKPLLARIFNISMIIVGICYFSVFTALLSANFTFEKIKPDISGPDDLSGRLIATQKDTSSIKPLEKLNVEILSLDSIDKAYDLLLRGKVEAVVYDTPSILYFANNTGGNNVTVLPELLKEEFYAIAAREGDPILESINRQLLLMYENGQYKAIYDKWFD